MSTEARFSTIIKQLPEPPTTPACKYEWPEIFDLPEWQNVALGVCRSCNVKAWCLEVVDPARSYFDGVAGGLVWKNGFASPDAPPYTVSQEMYLEEVGAERDERRKTEQPKQPRKRLIADFLNGVAHWKELTVAERQEVAVLLRIKGLSVRQIMEQTRLSAANVSLALKAWKDQLSNAPESN